MRRGARVLFVTSIVVISACGGGGGDSPGTAPSASPQTASSISPADIIDLASAEVPFAEQQTFEAEAYGINARKTGDPRFNELLREEGIQGSPLLNGETLRFGKVIAGDGKRALAFQLAPGDPITNASHRSELEFPKNIEHEKTYWYAYRIYFYDWGTLPAADEAFFGGQFHTGDQNIGSGGAHGLCVRGRDGAGRSFHVFAAWSFAENPRAVQSFRGPQIPIPFGRWVDFVGKIRHSQTNGLLQVWMGDDANGWRQIANYTGPLGLYTPGFIDYFKAGYYNWEDGPNTIRKLLLRSVVVVADPTGTKYKAEDLRAFINQ
jgi:hypothetical protein